LWRKRVGRCNTAGSIDMSDVDREKLWLFTLRALAHLMQRVRAYGELYSGILFAGSRRSGPLRFVAYVGTLWAGGCRKKFGGI